MNNCVENDIIHITFGFVAIMIGLHQYYNFYSYVDNDEDRKNEIKIKKIAGSFMIFIGMLQIIQSSGVLNYLQIFGYDCNYVDDVSNVMYKIHEKICKITIISGIVVIPLLLITNLINYLEIMNLEFKQIIVNVLHYLNYFQF